MKRSILGLVVVSLMAWASDEARSTEVYARETPHDVCVVTLGSFAARCEVRVSRHHPWDSTERPVGDERRTLACAERIERCGREFHCSCEP